MERLVSQLQAAWLPIRFEGLIWRNDPPGDVFRVGRSVPLGGSAANGTSGNTVGAGN
jgi:hypothetical protein